MTASLPPASVAAWTAAVELWESDNTQVNPFVVTLKSKFYIMISARTANITTTTSSYESI